MRHDRPFKDIEVMSSATTRDIARILRLTPSCEGLEIENYSTPTVLIRLNSHTNSVDDKVPRLPSRSQGQQPRAPQQQQKSNTSRPQEIPNGAETTKPGSKPASGPFDPPDNDTAHALFMLAPGRDGARSMNQFAVASGAPGHAYLAPLAPQNRNTSPQVSSDNRGSIGSARGPSDDSIAFDESEQTRLNMRVKSKRNLSPATGQRRADEPPTRVPHNKKSKTNVAAINSGMNFTDESKTKLEDSEYKLHMADEEKRKNFLERNRIAALKCRRRKKQWLTNLQTKVEIFDTENDALAVQVTRLREEAVNLKTLLFAHQDCPVTQQQRLYGAFISQVVGPFNPQIDPYGIAAPMPNQVMAGQGLQQRFS
ncbi:Transcription factor atf1 [Fusarium oxysporum f. sp. rapae]|uniref:Transcription factor atf1 n=1 Tax=Fusarium oxysporum f. sp. rapae TaxID=485398 RepID=A0A8J5NQP9_FUSOX|nr:Transcription factor atf1 [Fusarium oxysporum f. sp. rapae]